MSDQIQGATKMVPHQCQPVEMVVSFYRTCRTCWKEIEPVFCPDCDGVGTNLDQSIHGGGCRACSGTGVVEWQPVDEKANR